MGVALLALVIAASGVAVAAIPSSGGTILACYSTKNGALRVVESGQCAKGELPLSWRDGINGKVADSELLDGKDSTTFANGVNGKATDADKLDNTSSEGFLGATQKAADAEKLDGMDSRDFWRGQAGGGTYDLAQTFTVQSRETTTKRMTCLDDGKLLSGGYSIFAAPDLKILGARPDNGMAGAEGNYSVEVSNPSDDTGDITLYISCANFSP